MAALKADPTAQATQDLGQLRQTLFMGTTLRGMLLNAYAFATLGTIAMWAAIAAFIGSAVLFVLGFLGLRHAHSVEGRRGPGHRVDPRSRLTLRACPRAVSANRGPGRHHRPGPHLVGSMARTGLSAQRERPTLHREVLACSPYRSSTATPR